MVGVNHPKVVKARREQNLAYVRQCVLFLRCETGSEGVSQRGARTRDRASASASASAEVSVSERVRECVCAHVCVCGEGVHMR